jgi:hypothetical protein
MQKRIRYIKRKAVLVFATLGLLFLLMPTAQANGHWVPVNVNEVINRPLRGLRFYHLTKIMSHDREKFEFNWTADPLAISFYIFTRANFFNWSRGKPSTPNYSAENVTADETIFDTTGVNNTWVFVWDNPSNTQVQLLGTLKHYRWEEVGVSGIPGFPWAAVLLGTMLAMAIVILVRKRTR